MTKAIIGVVLYFFATLAYFYGEVKFLNLAVEGSYWRSSWWLTLKIVAIPMYAVGTLWLYQYGKSWSITEFPYWIMSIFVSIGMYASVMGLSISWREVVGSLLILGAAFLMRVE